MTTALLTTAEVADRLRKDEITVRRMCARGDLRAIKDGRQWLVPEADLEDYLDERFNRPRRKRRARNRDVA